MDAAVGQGSTSDLLQQFPFSLCLVYLGKGTVNNTHAFIYYFFTTNSLHT